MKHLLLAAIAALALEGAALACSCIMPPDDPVELRKMAAQSMEGAVALVEIQALTGYQPGGAETVRVTRTLAGAAPAEFQIQRGPHASSASCDKTYAAGDTDLVILYAPGSASAGPVPVYRTSGLCTDGLLQKAAFRDEVARLLGGGGHSPAERG